MSDLAAQKQVFLDAITANPRDYAARKIYADWLDEYTDDAEEAATQRRWNDEIQDSWEWLDHFLQWVYEDSYNEEYDKGRRRHSVQDLLEAAKANLLPNRRRADTIHLDYDTPDVCYEKSEEMWKHIGIVLGKDTKGRNWSVFSCSC